MLQVLETGKAFYVLVGICGLGILTRLMTGRLYKRLLKDSANLGMTKNRRLKELRQRAENTYRMNQGLRDSGIWLEHQFYELRFMGMTLAGWNSLSMQLTWLCLLAGAAGAFASYWYRLDTFYIVLYGGGAVMMAMLTMLFDLGAAGNRKEQLLTSLQDYLENVMYPKMARNLAFEGGELSDGQRGKRGIGRQRRGERFSRFGAGDKTYMEEERSGAAEAENEPVRAGNAGTGGIALNSTGLNVTEMSSSGRTGAEREGTEQSGISADSVVDGGRSAGTNRSGRKHISRAARRAAEAAAAAARAETNTSSDDTPDSCREVDYLKRSLEQIAASREKSRASEENWLKDLGPEEVQLIGDILKQYLV